MIRRACLLAVLSPVFLACLSHAEPDAADCPAALAGKIPARPADAVGGAGFIELLRALPPAEREAAIVEQVLAGNIPGFLRRLVPVKLTGTESGRSVTAIVCVMPDFLAIGSDEDFVRMPMDLPSSVRIAREFGFVLPTRKIVTAIHGQAAHRFKPEPMTPAPQMSSPGYYKTHNSSIRAQRVRDEVPLGALVAGHKKTVVLTNRLNERPGRIAIFGWLRRDGRPIQPLSTVHGAGYADYSHGIRLVSDTVFIHGRQHSIYGVLQDPKLAGILSREGVIRNLNALMSAPS